METYLASLLDWLQLHPHWAGIAVFVISCLESFLVIGLFVPGTVVMFGFGALVAAGAMDMGTTLLWAVVGAITGDGASFLIGRHYHQRLRVMWPFYKHPRLMARGVDFFHHHGGKSIIFARFIGPVRPILPAVAGMLNMSPGRFFLVNSLSALLWAPAYLLPGLVFGASLGLATEVAGRLALLLALLIAVIWACVWLVQRLFRFLQPHASQLLAWSLERSRRHPVIHPLAAALLDPAHPEARGMTILTGLLLAGSWGFMLTLQQVMTRSWLANLDPLVFHRLQALRTPWADQVMVFITQLGDGLVLSILVVGLALWLAGKGYWKACLHWVAAVAIAALLTRAIKMTAGMPRPVELYAGAQAFSFPSSHTSLSIVVFGFLAILMARELPAQRRWIPYVLATLLCVPIAFSRLYLGAHWLSDVLGGISLGLFWVALMGIAYRTHPGPAIPVRGLSLLTCLLLAVACSWNLQQHFAEQLQRYQPQRSQLHWDLDHWQREAWQQLPAYRRDLEGRQQHPLNLQWVGDPARIADWLDQQGWETPPALSLSTLLPEFTTDPATRALPVFPQVHDGRHETIRRVRYLADQQQLLVLRLWQADVHIGKGGRPLWIGTISLLQRDRILGLLTTLRTEQDFATPFTDLRQEITRWPTAQPWHWQIRETEARHPTLLLWPQGSIPALSPAG